MAETGTEPIMETRNLCCRICRADILSDLSVPIRRNARTVILGPNGAGKSSLLRLLHGLMQPNSGTILWHGQAFGPAAAMRQAMVFQRPVLLRRNCLDNVVFGLKPGSGNRTVKRDLAMRLLEQAGLGRLASKPARQLSGGEQQRLAIIRAMAREPELLFMDEPTASLDPASTNAIEQLVHAARLAGVTIVLVTHDAGQARRLADDVIFLQDGRLAESTAASSFFTQPASAAASAWLEGRLYLAQPPSGALQSC